MLQSETSSSVEYAKNELFDKLFKQADTEFGIQSEDTERYRSCYRDYAREKLKIRARDATLVPFEFNQVQSVLDAVAQKQLKEQGCVRVVVPKRRRGGVSTYVQGRLYWKCSLNPMIEAFTVAHETFSTKTIFNISRLMHEENKPQPATKYSSKMEIVFQNRSNQCLATAGSPEAARSRDMTMCHWSEVAFSPGADRIIGAAMACLPQLPAYSEAWFESSGNGYGNYFQRLCTEAYAEGKYPYYTHTDNYTYAYSHPNTEWVLVFFPWFCLPDASRQFRNHQEKQDFERLVMVPVYRPELGRSGKSDELEMMEKYNLTLEQLNWRRHTLVNDYMGNINLCRQEYPTHLDECFLTEGGQVFAPQLCDVLEEGCKGEWVDASLIARQGKVVARAMVNGPLRVYESPIKGESYLVSCDPAGGERVHQVDKDAPDNTVMDVWRRDGRYLVQVAQWVGRPDYDVIGDEAILLARLYNNAAIAVLRQNHGFAVLTTLSKEEWRDVVKDEDGNPGIAENRTTKPYMVDFLVGGLRDGYCVLRSNETVSELRTFVERNKKLGAEDGCRDDRVSSAYCGWHAHSLLPMMHRRDPDGMPRKRKQVGFVNAKRFGRKKERAGEEAYIRI